MPRQRRGAGREDEHVPRVQWTRHDFVWPGRVCGEPAVPDVSGQRPGAQRGVQDVRWNRRAAREEDEQVAVPPGSDIGMKIRLEGQGGRGYAGGPAGDMFVNLTVKPDRFYKREALDLIATVPLNIAQATLGSKVSVKTLDEKKVSIKIPAGTPGGKRFRVRGQGIEHGGVMGDLIVEVSIIVPEKLSPEQEKLMQEFAAAGGLKY